MRFSVLIPVHNVEKYLCQCVESIINQSFFDYEIILVDDGSTDLSGKICDTYAAKYPNLIRVFHNSNQGLLLTRRFSIKQACGEYILFLDSDDYVSDNYLSVIDENLRKYNCDLLLFNYWRFEDGSDQMESVSVPFKDGDIFEESRKYEVYEQFVAHYAFTNMWLKAVKADTIDRDYDYSNWNVSRCEDVIQSYALFDRAKRIAFVDQKIYYYRKSASCVTRSVRPKDVENYLMCAKRGVLYLKKWNLSDDIINKFCAFQTEYFMGYMRDIQELERDTKTSGVLAKIIRRIGTDESYIYILKGYDAQYSDKRIRIRMKLLKSWMLRCKWNLVANMIRLVNKIANLKKLVRNVSTIKDNAFFRGRTKT